MEFQLKPNNFIDSRPNCSFDCVFSHRLRELTGEDHKTDNRYFSDEDKSAKEITGLSLREVPTTTSMKSLREEREDRKLKSGMDPYLAWPSESLMISPPDKAHELIERFDHYEDPGVLLAQFGSITWTLVPYSV